MQFNALIPELAVTNCVASLNFYCKILGFTVAYQRKKEGFAFLEFGDSQLMLDQADRGRTFAADASPLSQPFGRGLNLQINCDDIETLINALDDSGIDLVLEPEEKWYRQGANEIGVRQIIVADPDGYLLRFSQSLGVRALSADVTPQNVLQFWFQELSPKDHFVKSDALDATLTARFGKTHEMLARELQNKENHSDHHWAQNAKDTLAAILVLDQFSRNMYRNTPASFGSDDIALSLAKMCVEKGWDADLDAAQKSFIYMPFMHSENSTDQAKCVELFQALGSEFGAEFAIKHQVIIERFGRFPHRNEILQRKSTPEEIAFLTEPNSSF